MFKSGRTFHGWMYQVKRRPIKKEGKKRWGEIGRKEREKRKKKRKKRKKKGEVTKQKERKGEGRWEEDRMKNRKEKERKKSWDQVLTKGSTVLGLNPVHWYI